MTTGILISLAVLLFFVGSLKAAMPSAKEKSLGALREQARQMGLNPRLVPCPDWLINTKGEKGSGMVALYCMVMSDAAFPLCEALVINDHIEVTNGNSQLSGTRCTIQGALGVVMQANFVGVYWDEQLDGATQKGSQSMHEKLTRIKENLQTWVEKVQA